MAIRPTTLIRRTVGVLWILVGFVGVLPAAFSAMMFDAPGADERLATTALAASVLTFPIACLFAASGAFKRLPPEASWRDSWPLFLPIVNLVVATAAAVWIEQFQGGKFNG